MISTISEKPMYRCSTEYMSDTFPNSHLRFSVRCSAKRSRQKWIPYVVSSWRDLPNTNWQANQRLLWTRISDM